MSEEVKTEVTETIAAKVAEPGPAPLPPEEKKATPPTVPKEENPESAVEILLKKQAVLEAKLAEIEAKNAELESRKLELDAQARLDKAQAEGWLLPAQLQEQEGKASVFVDLARDNPEIFDRLRLVMAPKAIPKKQITEAPADNTGAPLSDDDIYNRINALAKERGISYAAATNLILK